MLGEISQSLPGLVHTCTCTDILSPPPTHNHNPSKVPTAQTASISEPDFKEAPPLFC